MSTVANIYLMVTERPESPIPSHENTKFVRNPTKTDQQQHEYSDPL